MRVPDRIKVSATIIRSWSNTNLKIWLLTPLGLSTPIPWLDFSAECDMLFNPLFLAMLYSITSPRFPLIFFIVRS